MRKKVTVVGGGFVGSTTAQRIVDHELADVVLTDIVEGAPAGKALDMLESATITRSDSRIAGISTAGGDYGETANSDIVVVTAGFPRKPGMSRDDLLRADEYAVLACPNLNGDYLSDACAAQVGGLGMAPGANIGDGFGCFEATHGTAPKYADKDVINPSSVMLSGAMMFDFLGWPEAARAIEDGIAKTIGQKRVTYDLERLMEGATKLKTSEFASAIIENMPAKA